jgi:protein-ribulosamine 3-kinase
MTEGKYQSARAINAVVTTLVPQPISWGQYHDRDSPVYFIVSSYHAMNFSANQDPSHFAKKLADLHTKGNSPTGMFGFPIPTFLGKFARTVKWEKNWAMRFTNQLRDVIHYDNEVNRTWPNDDAACTQLIDQVIPRLLGALQSEGRNIEPELIHGDLWEQNVGTDSGMRQVVLFDPGSTYVHSEIEFGTWRCERATYFGKPECGESGDSKQNCEDSIDLRLYKTHLPSSEPVEEWDDRNRLYGLHPNLNNSAGHPDEETGRASRTTYVLLLILQSTRK